MCLAEPAAPNDALEYHRDFLVLDIDPRISGFANGDRLELIQVASRARWASDKRLVHLVQRRLGESRFSYLAIARPRPETLGVIDAAYGGRVMTPSTNSFRILKQTPAMSIPNRLTLDAVPATPIGDIAALPAEQLALLQQETDEAMRAAKAAALGSMARSRSSTPTVPRLPAEMPARTSERCASSTVTSPWLPTCRRGRLGPS